MLQKIIDSIPYVIHSQYEQTLMKALFLLAYYACLRASEVVCSNTDIHVLNLKNLAIDSRGVSIVFNSYKHSVEQKFFILEYLAETSYCPVKALTDFLALRGTSPGPIFLNKLQKLTTRRHYSSTLKKCLSFCGYNSTKYNTHSFRIGRATDLALHGISDQVIKETGRWKSNAFQKYIRFEVLKLPTV